MNYTVEQDFVAHGLRCVVLMTTFGHRCGYVGLPKGHPLHGLSYSEPTALLREAWERVRNGAVGNRGIIPLLCGSLSVDALQSADVVFDVHGSLTYSNGDATYPVSQSDGLWWFGFDCAHSGDAPEVERIRNATVRGIYRRSGHGAVRTQEYVADECRKLADQLAAFTAGELPCAPSMGCVGSHDRRAGED